jgi:hypothetical protein
MCRRWLNQPALSVLMLELQTQYPPNADRQSCPISLHEYLNNVMMMASP